RPGDGDDRLSGDHVAASVGGGPAQGVLDAGTGGGTLMGGDDDDVLHGNGQQTTLRGGPGDDELDGGGFDILEGGPGADAINGGGTGGDTVSYRDHTEPVKVDLSKPGSPAGAAGEGDT